MEDQKRENLLNLALGATKEERERSENLEVGYDPEEKTWELIVRYFGSLDPLREMGIRVKELIGGYAVLRVPESRIDAVSSLNQIQYIEQPLVFPGCSRRERAGRRGRAEQSVWTMWPGWTAEQGQAKRPVWTVQPGLPQAALP